MKYPEVILLLAVQVVGSECPWHQNNKKIKSSISERLNKRKKGDHLYTRSVVPSE